MIKIEEKDGKPVFVIPKEYEEPSWLSYMYIKNYTKDEEGNITVPCRPCDVTIIKPVIQQTPMGMMQTEQRLVEHWLYVDLPQKSILVNIGDDITEELNLKEKDNGETKSIPDTTNESTTME